MNLKLLITVLCWKILSGYKILGIFPYVGKSHFASFEPLMKALAAKGHAVTVISHFPQKNPLPNLTDIDLKQGSIFKDVISLNDVDGSRLQRYITPIFLAYLGYQTCTKGLSNPNLTKFLDTDPKFDVVIAEIFNTECFLGIVHKIKAPLIGISSCILMPWHNIMGLPNNPAFIPNSFMPFNDHMTFIERAENTFLYIAHVIFNKLFMDIPAKITAKRYLGDDLPNLNEITSNISVMLVNSHFSYSTPRPSVPGYVEVAGMHLGVPKVVPKHIEKWINESAHGVIYFSLGSMIKGHTFPEEKRQMFLRAFSRLPLRVIWKWEADSMPGKPDNIMIEKWLPQFDILCHPNVKAFIAHGGLLGATEAVHCGVPMVIMPQFGDQFTNAKAIEASGGGLILDYSSLNEESIFNTLTKVLDPSFNKKAKELSVRFRDRPLPPLETAIYWVEYVARHRGAPHLRTAAVGMPLYQYLLLDVLAFLATIFFSLVFIVYYLSRMLFRKLCSRKKSSDKVKIN